MKILTSKNERGFTLIELLVVIAIIGVLAALVLAALSSAQKGARDSQRKSDLNQYKTALAQYQSDKGGVYPTVAATVSQINDAGGVLSAPLSGTYMSSFPKPPQASTYGYIDTAATFGMCADLERGTDNFAVGPTFSGATPETNLTCTVKQ